MPCETVDERDSHATAPVVAIVCAGSSIDSSASLCRDVPLTTGPTAAKGADLAVSVAGPHVITIKGKGQSSPVYRITVVNKGPEDTAADLSISASAGPSGGGLDLRYVAGCDTAQGGGGGHGLHDVQVA